MVKFILIKSPDEWATTKQACRDELVVYLFFSPIYSSLYFYALSTVLRISSFTLIYTPISKNVVGENGEWQLSNGNCTTERNCGFYIWYAKTMSSSGVARLDGNKNPTNLHI